MMTLMMAAAVAAAQPTPPAHAHAPMMAERHDQHEAKKDKCCCDDMAKGEPGMDAGHPHGEHGGQ